MKRKTRQRDKQVIKCGNEKEEQQRAETGEVFPRKPTEDACVDLIVKRGVVEE